MPDLVPPGDPQEKVMFAAFAVGGVGILAAFGLMVWLGDNDGSAMDVLSQSASNTTGLGAGPIVDGATDAVPSPGDAPIIGPSLPPSVPGAQSTTASSSQSSSSASGSTADSSSSSGGTLPLPTWPDSWSTSSSGSTTPVSSSSSSSPPPTSSSSSTFPLPLPTLPLPGWG